MEQELLNASGRDMQRPKPQSSRPIAIRRDFNSSHQSHNSISPNNQQPHQRAQDQSDDDDDSSVDVERDARKIQQQYGEKAGVLSSSQSAERRTLNAPYLGSMSRSENYHLSLPPINLSSNIDDPEPSLEIGRSYGSLRESHETRKFLDGPASYRDPAGHIRRLDNRERYSSSYTQPSVSIRDRMQKARKLQEIKKAKAKEDEPTSSLAAMMDRAALSTPSEESSPSKLERSKENPTKNEQTSGSTTESASSNGLFVHSHSAVPINFEEGGIHEHQSDDAAGMLSTSLTGLEVLMTSSHLDHSQPASSANMNNGDAPSSVPVGPASFLLVPPSHHSQHHVNPFKPLGRSLSDPTPSQQSNMNITQNMPRMFQTSIPNGNFAALPSTPVHSNMNMINASSTSVVNTQAENSGLFSAGRGLAATDLPVTEPAADHNPDTDAAFDMDME